MTAAADAFRWAELLARWNADLIQTPEIARRLPSDVVASGWLGYPGATEAQVQGAEARLGTALPPSYRAFLKVTNGWRHLGYFHTRLWSAEEVDWFRLRNQQWIDAWIEPWQTGPTIPDNEYFIYGVQQEVTAVRVEYMPSLLEISDIGDSVILLLNPSVVFPDGEWEAWDLGNWYPGARRYRSFWDLMEAKYTEFVAMREHKAHR